MAIGVALLALTPVRAGDDTGPVYYFSTRTVEVDLKPVVAGAAPVERVQLWITVDGGTTWEVATDPQAANKPLLYTAPKDGRYGFRAVAIDRAGREQNPPQPGDAPELSCEIDTRAPRIEVGAPLVGEIFAGSHVVFDWDVIDRNLGGTPVRIEYQRDGVGPWEDVPFGSDPALPVRGKRQWFLPLADGSINFRVRVEDLAGNRTEWTTPEPIDIVPFHGFRGARGVAADPFSSFRRFPIFYTPVRLSTVEIARVEIWYRRGFSDWQRKVDPDRVSPYVFESDGDGRYSIYVRMISQNGVPDRPAPGPDTLPDLKITVDTHSPMGALEVARGAPQQYHASGEPIALRWALEDENLAPERTRLEISIDDGRSWSPLAERFDSRAREGIYEWTPPLIEAESLRFRLVGRDHAGNAARFVADSRVFLINPRLNSEATAKQHHLRAIALSERGDRASLVAAVERLELSINYNPREASAWHDRGALLTQLGRHREALRDYVRAREIAPRDLQLAFSLVQGYLNLHRVEDVAEHLTSAREVFGTISKVQIYQQEDYRTLLATYRVLETALEE